MNMAGPVTKLLYQPTVPSALALPSQAVLQQYFSANTAQLPFIPCRCCVGSKAHHSLCFAFCCSLSNLIPACSHRRISIRIFGEMARQGSMWRFYLAVEFCMLWELCQECVWGLLLKTCLECDFWMQLFSFPQETESDVWANSLQLGFYFHFYLFIYLSFYSLSPLWLSENNLSWEGGMTKTSLSKWDEWFPASATLRLCTAQTSPQHLFQASWLLRADL